MNDREAFLRAIIDNPDDDLPRLVYADYLDERGDGERSEFIRVECELHDRLPENGGSGDAWKLDELRRRRRELLAANWDHWHYEGDLTGRMFCEDLNPAPPCPWPWIRFRRGFVGEVACSWEDFARHHVVILEEYPIRRVNRAKLRPCTRCRKGIIPHTDDVSCEYCGGSGEMAADVPDWRGDGRVWLMTWPEVGYKFGVPQLWFGGRLVAGKCADYVSCTRYNREAILDCLGVALPGVRFELPR